MTPVVAMAMVWHEKKSLKSEEAGLILEQQGSAAAMPPANLHRMADALPACQ